MKTLSEVLKSLSVRWDAPTKEIQGYDYVPWEESVYQANSVFGPLGWDSVVKSCQYVEATVPVNKGTREQPQYENVDFKGFVSIVTVRVRVYDEEREEVVVTEHDGIGFGDVQGQGGKNPMDTACKAAKSDGISTAVKHFGDTFALYLYREKKRNGQGSSTSSNGNNGYKQSNGNTSNEQKKWPVSDGRKPHMMKQFKLTKEQVNDINFIDNDTAKDMLELLWHKDEEKKKSVAEILAMPQYAHLKPPAPASKSTPVDSADSPF